jgi:hypothetical protein
MAYEWIPAAVGAVGSAYDYVAGANPPSFNAEGPLAEQVAAQKALADYEARMNRPTVNTPQGSISWKEKTAENPEYTQLRQAWEQGRLVNDAGTWGKQNSSEADFQAYAQQQGVSPTVSQGWEQNVSLSPEQQKIYDAQTQTAIGRNQLAQSMLPQAQEALGKGIDYNALPSAGQSLQGRDLATQLDFSGAPGLSSGEETRNRAEEALYGRATARLDPQMKEQESELRTRLYNQGLREGDAAFDAEVSKFNQSKQDAYAAARQDAITAGGAEASREYGMDLSSRQQSVAETTNQAQFMNQAAAQGLSQDQAIQAWQQQLRQNALAEQQGARSQALNEMNSLQSGQQVTMPTQQQFSATNVGSAPNYTAAAQAEYNSNLNAYNANQAQQNNMWGAAAQLTPYLFGYGGNQSSGVGTSAGGTYGYGAGG